MLMTHAVMMILTAATLAGDGHRRGPLVARGGDPARGILANLNPGVPPFALPDPSRPTIVLYPRL